MKIVICTVLDLWRFQISELLNAKTTESLQQLFFLLFIFRHTTVQQYTNSYLFLTYQSIEQNLIMINVLKRC
jgi:hypothetical protein